MPHRFAILLSFVCLGMTGCGRHAPDQRSVPYRTELQWLVFETAQDIAEMGAYAARAAGRDPSRVTVTFADVAAQTGDVPAFDLVIAMGDRSTPVRLHLVLDDYVWSPATFAQVAARVLPQRPSPVAGSASSDDTMLAVLRDLRVPVIQKQNLATSKRLADNMLDPEAHEAAALILAAFTLREASGVFWDVRSTLCRMAAHLSMARALRGDAPFGLSGRYAEAVLLVKAGRERDALQKLDALGSRPGITDAERSWLLALRLRATDDWRLAESLRGGSLLERLSAYAARFHAMSVDQAFARLQREEPDLHSISDWGRYSLRDDSVRVDIGRVFADSAVAVELAEIEEVWSGFEDRGAPPKDWVPALNEPRTRCLAPIRSGQLTPQVLSWGTWAAFLQRHLCGQIWQSEAPFTRALGLPDGAKEAAREHDRTFAGLDLYPFVRLLRARWTRDPAGFVAAGRDAVRLIERSPELLTFIHLADLRWRGPGWTQAVQAPPEQVWFKPILLPGTAYEGADRLWFSWQLHSAPPAVGEGLHQLSPWNYAIAMEHVRRSKGLTLAEKRVIYGPLLGFHARAMEDFSWEVHAASPVWSDEWVTIQRKLCERDADSCDLLARYLAARGKEREAAQIYQRGIDEAVNVIRAANNSGWLVGYYLDHGEKARALAIAQMAANVYSATGLLVMARTLERLGRLDEAEAYHRKVIERYEGDAAFTGFLFRQVNERGLTRYEPELRRRLAASFPRGPEKLDMAQLGSPPPDGVRIAYPSDFTRLEGIDVSDVIVAVDGWRVHTGRQYSYACEFSRGFRLEIEVWRDGTYRQVHAFLPMRFLGVELTPYTSGARAGVPAKSPR